MSSKQKGSGLFISLIILNFLNFCTYGIPVTYFPQVAKKKGLMDYAIGIIFSMYPLFSFIFCLIVVKMLNRLDRRHVIKYSQMALGLSTLVFGFSTYFSHNSLFILTALIGRGVQGMSIGAYTTSSYAYVPDYWPEEIDKKIIILEIFLSFGIGVGPLLGSLIYEIWGYISIYVVPGILIFVVGVLLAHFFFPACERHQSKDDEKKEVLNFGESFKIKEIIYLILIGVINLTSFTLIMPEFENKIVDLNETPQVASIIFSMQAIGYVLGCIIQLICKFENRQGLFFLSLIFNLLSLLFLGSDELVQIDNFYILICMGIGLFIMGWAIAFSMIPFISEAILILKRHFPNRQEETLSNMASAMFNAAIAVAEFQGPIIGGILEDFIGFSLCCLVFCVVSLLFFILFATHGNGFHAFKQFFVKKTKIDTLNGEKEFLGEMFLYNNDNNSI